MLIKAWHNSNRMKDTKTFLLLLVSILLIVVSVFLLWTWTYRVKAIVATAEKKPGSISIISEPPAMPGRDSIQRFYNDILAGINKSIVTITVAIVIPRG